MITWIAAGCCLLALIPAVLFLRNLSVYRPLPSAGKAAAACSILIPARNEAANIEKALRSILQSEGVDFEVIVLDDGSTDRTSKIVEEVARQDARVRLEVSRPLPEGWCGKNFACHQLAAFARNPVLIFMDADVRVSRRDSIARLATFLDESGSGLVSGLPQQHTSGLLEKLIVPLIHFVLLGFLPLRRMRSNNDPRFAAACGQILAVRSDAYVQTGGHCSVPDRIHDAVALTRSFRKQGLRTDLFDATDTFGCRMYQSACDVWNGFSKNAHEGLGAPRLILPATLILLGGQVIPIVLLAFVSTTAARTFCALAAAASFLPRLVAAVRFRQPKLGAVLHPVGISALVIIQWVALFRCRARSPVAWKGRTYPAVTNA